MCVQKIFYIMNIDVPAFVGASPLTVEVKKVIEIEIILHTAYTHKHASMHKHIHTRKHMQVHTRTMHTHTHT